MSKKTEKRKKQQLGISPGTARNRLVKSLIFKLAKDLDLNWCFQCGAEIENKDELSIEHKVPWLDSENPKELYYDLDNIAFSHHSCNVGAARQPLKVDYGFKSKCHRCNEIKDKSKFHKKSSRHSGVDHECKSCKSKRMKEYTQKKRRGE